jgi:hypothetical protein
MREIQECYWLVPPVRAEYSRKCFGIITPSTKVVFSRLFDLQEWKQRSTVLLPDMSV